MFHISLLLLSLTKFIIYQRYFKLLNKKLIKNNFVSKSMYCFDLFVVKILQSLRIKKYSNS